MKELSHKQLNNLKLKKLGYFNKNPNMLRFDDRPQKDRRTIHRATVSDNEQPQRATENHNEWYNKRQKVAQRETTSANEVVQRQTMSAKELKTSGHFG